MADRPTHTRESVEAALIAGFASLSSRPCMSLGPRLVEGHAPLEALALNWAADHVPDRQERIALLSWVRCQVKEESWSDFCRGMCWEKRTEDRRRERAALRIVEALNFTLDTVPERTGPMEHCTA